MATKASRVIMAMAITMVISVMVILRRLILPPMIISIEISQKMGRRRASTSCDLIWMILMRVALIRKEIIRLPLLKYVHLSTKSRAQLTGCDWSRMNHITVRIEYSGWAIDLILLGGHLVAFWLLPFTILHTKRDPMLTIGVYMSSMIIPKICYIVYICGQNPSVTMYLQGRTKYINAAIIQKRQIFTTWVSLVCYRRPLHGNRPEVSLNFKNTSPTCGWRKSCSIFRRKSRDLG